MTLCTPGRIGQNHFESLLSIFCIAVHRIESSENIWNGFYFNFVGEESIENAWFGQCLLHFLRPSQMVMDWRAFDRKRFLNQITCFPFICGWIVTWLVSSTEIDDSNFNTISAKENKISNKNHFRGGARLVAW